MTQRRVTKKQFNLYKLPEKLDQAADGDEIQIDRMRKPNIAASAILKKVDEIPENADVIDFSDISSSRQVTAAFDQAAEQGIPVVFQKDGLSFLLQKNEPNT